MADKFNAYKGPTGPYGMPMQNISPMDWGPMYGGRAIEPQSIQPANISVPFGMNTPGAGPQLPAGFNPDMGQFGNTGELSNFAASPFTEADAGDAANLDKSGGWLGPAKFALDVGKLATGVWGGLEQQKQNERMNEFMKQQTALQTANYEASAKDTNRQIADQAMMQASAAGHRFGSPGSQAAIDKRRREWGVSETV